MTPSPAFAPTPSGRRWHYVSVQNPGPPQPDGDGGYTEGWTLAAPALWRVAIEPATARDLERLAAGSTITTATHVITGPYHPAITAHSRLVYDGRVFDVIAAPRNPDERNRETIVICAEVTP